MKYIVITQEMCTINVEYIVDLEKGRLPDDCKTVDAILATADKRTIIKISDTPGIRCKTLSCEPMKTYRIPVVWTMTGIVEVQAKDLASAIEIAHDSELPKGSYLDDSFSIDSEDIEEVEAS